MASVHPRCSGHAQDSSSKFVKFNLDGDRFLRNLRSARRGAAAGPLGMTVEHLQPLLDHSKDAKRFHQVAELLSRAKVPALVRDAVRLGRLTALQKPNGGVRGIVAGNIVRPLVARTMSQQLMKDVERATAPFQYALSTRTGCECIAHAFQGITELDPRSTVMSIDGINAYDFISRSSMMQGIHKVHAAAVLFVFMFYGTASTYVWEDDEGTTHKVVASEGGEQVDAMMPLLSSLGQHHALEVVQAQFFP